ncbi:MAG TPA: VOC family protein [Patescibacteria group bacterium]|nr:VOC family protein [Patescibacteria group bacterium]
MLKDNKTFSSFSTNDLSKAKEFYGDTLGIETKENEMGTLELHLGHGGMAMIYPKPDHKPATFTVLNFLVDDVEKTVDELASKDIHMEHYDMGDYKSDEKGIMKNPDGGSIAWFTDPAGNILSIIEDKK